MPNEKELTLQERMERDISFPIPNEPLLLLESIVELWWEFFKRNRDYRRYCDARRQNDVATCKTMEKEFTKLSSLYDDWGDLYDESGVNEWNTWIESRRHLFGLCEVNFSDDVAVYDPEAYVMNVSIPIYTTKKELLNLIDGFLERNSFLLGVGQKYRVTQNRGEDLNKLYEMLVRYDYIVTYLMADPSVKKELDFGGVSELFNELISKESFRNYLKLNWDTAKGGDPSAIHRMLKDYYKCVEATIHGEFPRRRKKKKKEEASSSIPDRLN